MVTFIFSNGTSLTLDATLAEKHTGKVTVTKHPVEVGVNPSDHATLMPEGFSVEGMFTNLPLSEHLQAARLGGRFVSQMVDFMWAMLGAREALTVKSSLRRLPNCMMTSLSMPNTAEIGEAVQFSAEFEQVQFVQTQTVKLAPVQTSVPQKPTQKNQQGTKGGQPVEARKSHLDKLGHAFGVFND